MATVSERYVERWKRPIGDVDWQGGEALDGATGVSESSLPREASVSTLFGDAVFLVNGAGSIESFNDAAVRLFGPFVDGETIEDWTERHGFSGKTDSPSDGIPFRECLQYQREVVRELSCRTWWKQDQRWFQVACLPGGNECDSDRVLIVFRGPL